MNGSEVKNELSQFFVVETERKKEQKRSIYLLRDTFFEREREKEGRGGVGGEREGEREQREEREGREEGRDGGRERGKQCLC